MFGKFEPILNAQTVSTVISAILTALVAFNVPLTDPQRNAILGLVGAVSAIFWVGAITARQAVTPVEKVIENVIPLVPDSKQAAVKNVIETGDPIAA